MMLGQATLLGPHHSFPTDPCPEDAYLSQELITPCVPRMQSRGHSFINRTLGQRLRRRDQYQELFRAHVYFPTLL